MTGSEFLEVGRIHKPHGLRGEVSVSFVSNRAERWGVGAKLKVSEEWLTVQASRVHQGRMLLRFEGFTDRSGVERLSGKTVYAVPIEEADVLWVHKLIGSRLIDSDGIDRGAVVDVIDNPASDLMRTEEGALVPLVFVTSFDADAKIVVVDVPDGLFEVDQ